MKFTTAAAQSVKEFGEVAGPIMARIHADEYRRCVAHCRLYQQEKDAFKVRVESRRERRQ